MNPKEEANKLFSTYLSINLSQVNDLVDGIRISLAKECALITVDKMLSVISTGSYYESFYKDVKEEIEKL